MIASKMTSKAQTTIPQAVRTALRLKEGDSIIDTLEANGRVTISRAPHETPLEDPFGTFSEWDSEADRRAYADL
jgi:antitoxin PrlF